MIRNALREGGFGFDEFVCVASGSHPSQLLRRVELAPQSGQQVHSSIRLAVQQDCNVITGHLNARGFLEGDGIRLVKGLLKHGGKSKKLAARRLINDDLLLVLVNRADAHFAGYHHVRLATSVPSFVDAFARAETLDLDLSGEDCGLIVVEQRKERNAS
jgi:hypothetical protein